MTTLSSLYNLIFSSFSFLFSQTYKCRYPFYFSSSSLNQVNNGCKQISFNPRFALFKKFKQTRYVYQCTSLSSRSIIQIANNSLIKQDFCQGLNHRQIHFCRRNEHLMPFIHFGIHLTLEECQNQFKNRLWNCILFHNNHLIGNILHSGWVIFFSSFN